MANAHVVLCCPLRKLPTILFLENEISFLNSQIFLGISTVAGAHMPGGSWVTHLVVPIVAGVPQTQEGIAGNDNHSSWGEHHVPLHNK